MSRMIINLFFIFLLFEIAYTQKQDKNVNKKRSLLPHPLYNTTSKNIASLKIHSKLLQTVYSDSFSKNFYYTTLYVGHNKVRQTYIIDTGSSIMASPCSPCPECGVHKNPFYYDLKRSHKPLQCSSNICKLTATTSCVDKTLKFLTSNTCSFKIKREGGEGISGYYMRDVVYFETDRQLHRSPLHKKVFRSYALPVGCTTAEYGKYKELNTDGIMGMSNSPKSFISILYNLKVINTNLFTLCFGLRGGYMSLGEIEKTFHRSEDIEYVPLLTSDVYYLVKLTGVKVGGDKAQNSLKTPVIATVDTGNSISYFPSIVFKEITKQFKDYCMETGGKCGNFTFDEDMGYCASFQDRESLFKAIFQYWPNITLNFGESAYIWKPINYYYYHFSVTVRRACLGFNYHSSEKVTLGANFIHGHDIIFDRAASRLGFVPSDCSRGNLIWNRWQGILGNKAVFETTDPILMDKELHHSEIENKFHLGDNNRENMIDFVQGHNTELDKKEFSTINYIILITSIVIVVVVLIIILSVLLCGRKKLTYEEQQQESEYNAEDQHNEVNTSDDNNPDNNSNKIAFEENNPQEINLEDDNQDSK